MQNRRRYPNGADDPAGSIESLTTRGFTGHETLDSVALVHMKGGSTKCDGQCCDLPHRRGGRCQDGALSGAVGAAATPLVNVAFPDPRNNVGDYIGGTAATGLIGGLASVAGGGKFENGAVTAAFGYMFNAAAWCMKRPEGCPTVEGGGARGFGGGGGGGSSIFRSGGSNPGNLTTRNGEQGLSFRDSLSNPVQNTGRPVFEPGKNYIEVDSSKLPRGSVIYDNNPAGHVTVQGVTPDVLKGAIVNKGKFPE